MSARWILRFYPRLWRERYQDEMMALLEQHVVTPFTLLDLLLGALDAHLDSHYHEPYTLRPVTPAFLAVFPLFVLTVCYWVWQLQDPPAAFYGSLDAANDITNDATIISVSYAIMFISFIFVTLSIFIGSLLIVLLTVQRTFVADNRRKHLLTWLSVLVTIVSLVGVILNIVQGRGLFFLSLLLVAALAALCTWSLMPGRGGMSGRSVRVMLIPAVIGIIAMSISVAANLIWGLSLLTSMSFVATMPVLPQGNWLVAWLVDSLLMAFPVAVVFFILIRGFVATISAKAAPPA